MFNVSHHHIIFNVLNPKMKWKLWNSPITKIKEIESMHELHYYYCIIYIWWESIWYCCLHLFRFGFHRIPMTTFLLWWYEYIYRCLHEIWSAMRYVVCIKFLNKINTKWIHDDECVKHTITATAIFHTIPMLHADYIYEKKKTRQSLYHIRQKKN